MVKLLKGSIVMDLSKLRVLDDRELIAIIKELNRLSSQGYDVLVSLAPFNANALYRGKIYRISISHGAIIISPGELGDKIKNICGNIEGDLCWRLSEDVWADTEKVSYRLSLDNKYPCPQEYIDSSRELGYIISDTPESSKVACIDSERSISIDIESLRSRLLIIPHTEINEYRRYLIEKEAGFRHPISVILGGRRVSCSEPLDLDLPGESTPLIKDISGNILLYSIDSDIYVFACKPSPNELLYKLALFYISLVKKL
ncbi:MAG: hypothetical protein ACO2O0_09000 [Desulfurococcales archaeon]